MKRIYKYRIDAGVETINIPIGGTILHVNNIDDNIFLWVEIDPNKETETEERIIEVFGTGHNIYDDMGTERKYIGTVKLQEGALIFHIYERIS